ncbi:TIGR02281 family clan AA aspartic protease [Mameliella alba]|uniref:TIGR02281 family clan AA aspartic protease n=1 Tax=Mameliella alba TaxID=561184 RepID=UPI000B53198A|nr:TIGR02281 family clan AA aspartic protease [Mameliella alba]MBV6635696.1 TIGR02281 family clan AA aspartic protease [Mameliella sp.]MBY6120107.1 TIGR02281 family clan AA aspartic protease [Mameliella alba]OWV45808.1 TIGR02281 family clan AA aspartic protease [Mameliella alba]OWV64383.1 TIGR02281 family clan AA aspartic protease [Mameliella alba]BBU56008.1 aspartyl protease [Mameliella alba]
MSGDQIGNLIYLVLLGSVIAGWFFVQNRNNLNKSLQYMAAWALIFVGVVAIYGLWQDIRQTVQPQQMVTASEGRIELPRAPDGHYYVNLQVNGAPVRFVVDTGATSMVLTRDAARRAGIDDQNLHFLTEAMTANGVVRTARVTLDEVAIGPFTDTRVPAYVNGGEMQNSLLGMSYLDRFASLQITGGKLVLQR